MRTFPILSRAKDIYLEKVIRFSWRVRGSMMRLTYLLISRAMAWSRWGGRRRWEHARMQDIDIRYTWCSLLFVDMKCVSDMYNHWTIHLYNHRKVHVHTIAGKEKSSQGASVMLSRLSIASRFWSIFLSCGSLCWYPLIVFSNFSIFLFSSVIRLSICFMRRARSRSSTWTWRTYPLSASNLSSSRFFAGKARMAWGPFVSRSRTEIRMTSICFMMCVTFRKE